MFKRKTVLLLTAVALFGVNTILMNAATAGEEKSQEKKETGTVNIVVGIGIIAAMMALQNVSGVKWLLSAN